MNQEVAAPSPAVINDSAASDLIATLRERAPRLALAFAAAQAAIPAARWARSQVRERTTYTVKISGADDVYDDLHEWVLSQLAPREQRALVAWSARRFAIIESPGRQAPPPASLRLRYDGSREHVIRAGGHKIKVMVIENEGGDGSDRWKPPDLLFTARSVTAREVLLDEIGGVLRRRQEAARKPSFRMLGKWGDWERLDDLPPRGPESVILPSGQMERLIGDVGRFLAAEDDYVRRSVPWHRGHLYEGLPGTGKTSVARAIASHFGMDIWYLPLADVTKDGELLRMAGRVSPRSMLLLEDIDVFHAATKRDDDAEVTLSGLLNALDGIATPHGLLTVMTTNTPEVLDEALARPGRADLVEHFALAGEDQIARLVSRWYGLESVDACGLSGVSPAAVTEACKRNDTAQAALADLLAAPVLAAR